MPDRLSLKYSGAAFLIAVSFGVSSPAHAGFQWVAPRDSLQPTAPAANIEAPQDIPLPVQPAAPALQTLTPPSSPEIISPLVITGTPYEPAVAADKPVADKNVVVGFAKSVPLPVALRQILPNGYAFSIDPDVDMGTLVSFKGGRPWRETLKDTLKPVGLTMHEHGQMVAVGFPSHNLAEAVPVPLPAPVPTLAPIPEPKPITLSAPPTISVITPLPDEAIKMTPVNGASDNLTQTWTADRGQHLRKVLEEWSRRADVEFDWLSEYDFPLEASVSFSGTFESAVRDLLTGFEGAHPQPVAELHANQNIGQLVLVVRTRGNANAD